MLCDLEKRMITLSLSCFLMRMKPVIIVSGLKNVWNIAYESTMAGGGGLWYIKISQWCYYCCHNCCCSAANTPVIAVNTPASTTVRALPAATAK